MQNLVQRYYFILKSQRELEIFGPKTSYKRSLPILSPSIRLLPAILQAVVWVWLEYGYTMLSPFLISFIPNHPLYVYIDQTTHSFFVPLHTEKLISIIFTFHLLLPKGWRNLADAATGMFQLYFVTIHVVQFIEVCFMVIKKVIVFVLLNVTIVHTVD